MGKNYYCDTCDKGYDHAEKHWCKAKCPCCYKAKRCLDDGGYHYCVDCNRYFKNDQCFENHKRKYKVNGGEKNKRRRIETSNCEKIKRCKDCDVLVDQANAKREPHKCGYFYCSVCRENVLYRDHKCYIRPLKKAEDEEEILIDMGDRDEAEDTGLGEKDVEEESFRYVFFDYEARQEKVIDENQFGPILEHEVNLCVAHIVCNECLDKEKLGDCLKCGSGKKLFQGDNCKNECCDWLFSFSFSGDKKIKTTAIAHNMKGYDGQFIMQYLHEQAIRPDIVPKGLELMCIRVKKVRIIDSINFLPMALSALPKSFGLEEVKKGYFPHFFNRRENLDYNGVYPDAAEYGPANMKPDARSKFYQWYNKQVAEGKQFSEEEELLAYCESDVRRCCLRFRKIFMDETGLDPFLESTTIAGACNKVYRKLFLNHETIGIIPHGGYRRNDKQSIIALMWLAWISHSRNIDIRHSRNHGEVQIGQYKVDGQCMCCKKQVFEFYGCYWHGCTKCLTRRNQKTADGRLTAEEAYQRTMRRNCEIEAKGFTVNDIWECDFRRQIRTNAVMKDFIDSIKITEPMDPRESFYGGRTNTTKLYHKAKRGEKINYIDVVSLYPWVCKYGKFPIGHPEILTENFANVSTTEHPYEGLMKITILPPRKLLHPVLPFRNGGKLLFPLCKTCAEARQQEKCRHADEERMLTGSWATPEIYKALELGYKLVKIYEVWQYTTVAVFDPETRSGGLFADYIDKFLKLKQQADGWPGWVKTESDKEKYIRDYEEHEGIKLDPTKIEKNAGLRALAKLMLNSFWGKFGQRNNMGKTEYFTKPNKYCEVVFDPVRIIQSINMVSEMMTAVAYKYEDDFVEVLGNTNVVVAAYTTTQARLKLYSYIEQLQERVLYFDTDWVIYTSMQGQWEPQLGSYLGYMSNELKDYPEGSFISEMVSGGPKNYGYKVCIPDGNGRKKFETVVKVRGFTLSNSAQKRLNFKTMKRMVTAFVKNGCKEEFVIVSPKIERTGADDRKVITKYVGKKYRVVYDKRVVKSNFCTLPYGY